MINTGGKTSYAFGSFNWRIPIWKMLFFEGEFGGAVNNSPDWQGPGRIDMGCAVTFRESGGFGFQLTANWDVDRERRACLARQLLHRARIRATPISA